MADNENKQSVMDDLMDPRGLKDSAKFQIGLSSLKMLMMMIFSFAGVAVSFGLDSIDDLANASYWVQFAILLFEQNYCYSAGYQMGLAVMKKKRPDFNNLVREANEIVEGVVDQDTGKIVLPSIKVDAQLVKKALVDLNIDGKKEMVIKRADEKADALDKKINKIKDRHDPHWFQWPFRKMIQRGRLKKVTILEQKKKRYIDKKTDQPFLDSLKTRVVRGYQIWNYADLVGEFDNNDVKSTTGYQQRSQKSFERKGFFQRNVTKILTAVLGAVISYSFAISGKEFWGRAAYTLFIMIMQFSSGWSDAAKTMDAILIPNLNDRIAALFDVKSRVKDLKAKAAEEQKKQEAALAALLTSWIEADIFDKQFNIDREKKRLEAEAKAKLEAQAKPAPVVPTIPGNAQSPAVQAKTESEQMLLKEKAAAEARMKLTTTPATI